MNRRILTATRRLLVVTLALAFAGVEEATAKNPTRGSGARSAFTGRSGPGRSFSGARNAGPSRSSGRMPAMGSPRAPRPSSPTRQAAPRRSIVDDSPRRSVSPGSPSRPTGTPGGVRNSSPRQSPKLRPSSPVQPSRPQRIFEAPSASRGTEGGPREKGAIRQGNPVDRNRSIQPRSDRGGVDGARRAEPSPQVGSEKKMNIVSNPRERGAIQPRRKNAPDQQVPPGSDLSPKRRIGPEDGTLASSGTRGAVIPDPAGRRFDDNRRFDGGGEFKSRRGSGDHGARGKNLPERGWNQGRSGHGDIDIDVDINHHGHGDHHGYYHHGYYNSWHSSYYRKSCFAQPWYYPTSGFSLGVAVGSFDFGYSRYNYDYDYGCGSYYGYGYPSYAGYCSSYWYRPWYRSAFADCYWYRPTCYTGVTTYYTAPVYEEVIYYDTYPDLYYSYVPSYSYSYGWPCVGDADYDDDVDWYASVSYWD